MESIKLEYRAIIKFVLNEGCSVTTAHQCLVAVYNYSVPNYPMVTRRFNKLERGRQSLEDDLQSGRPSNAVNAISVAAVEKLTIANRTANGSEILKELYIAAVALET